jgi:hypothetical protein
MSNASGEVFKPLTDTSLSHCNRHQQRHTPHNKLPEFRDVHQHKAVVEQGQHKNSKERSRNSAVTAKNWGATEDYGRYDG